ncbi:MAG: RNase adapter RapZ [Alphaproteobacteria bacterium]|nr:RNase adapter RapZ [Alphaproteobacteria bacterium]
MSDDKGKDETRTPVLLVTGMSGAGRSTALKVLEDMGWEAIDNLPLALLPDALKPGEMQRRPVAVGIDIRARNFDPKRLEAVLEPLRARDDLALHLLFLDCEDEVLRRRYTETRRRHPLAKDAPVTEGIQAERRLITPLAERADLVIDTSRTRAADLRTILAVRFTPRQAPRMTVTVLSFAFRNGLPREADFVFDLRFLRNPHYDSALRPLDGRDPAVGAHIEADPAFAPFFETLAELLVSLLPRFTSEGKSYLTLAFGCTGGRHRSVFAAERMARRLETAGQRTALVHRDLGQTSE